MRLKNVMTPKPSPKPLKIGFVFDDSLDKPDGVQQYMLSIGSWLTSQGHEVHYLVGKEPDLPCKESRVCTVGRRVQHRDETNSTQGSHSWSQHER